MLLRVGTSGFGYRQWRGRFYPARLPAHQGLRHYARQAPRRITHTKRLREVAGETTALRTALRALGPRLGMLPVQLPPDFAADRERLAGFLALLPAGCRAGVRCGYLRLRRARYSERELAARAPRLRAQRWVEAFAYFKHEVEGPERALALREAFERAGGAPRTREAIPEP